MDRLTKISRNEHRRGARFTQEMNVFSISEEADLSGRRFRQRRGSRDLQGGIAQKFTAGCFRELFDSKSHRQDRKRIRTSKRYQLIERPPGASCCWRAWRFAPYQN